MGSFSSELARPVRVLILFSTLPRGIHASELRPLLLISLGRQTFSFKDRSVNSSGPVRAPWAYIYNMFIDVPD